MIGWLKKEDGTSWLDDMPQGWNHRFGKEMIDNILYALKKANLEDVYQIIYIGESYGTLVWEDNIVENTRLMAVKNFYKNLSKTTCIFCGAPNAELYDAGWTHPACNQCKPLEKIPKKLKERKKIQMYDWDNDDSKN